MNPMLSCCILHTYVGVLMCQVLHADRSASALLHPELCPCKERRAGTVASRWRLHITDSRSNKPDNCVTF